MDGTTAISNGFSPDAGMGERKPWIGLWTLVAIVSPTAEIACQLVLGYQPDWLVWARITVLAAVIVASTRIESLVRLRPFALAYLVLFVAAITSTLAQNSDTYEAATARGFVWSQLLLVLVGTIAVDVPALLWCGLRQRDRFFLRAGNLAAPVGPLGVRWSAFAPIFAVIGALSAWLFIVWSGTDAVASWSMALIAVLMAARNAFHEELLYRNLLIGALKPHFGAIHAVAVSAFIFGVGHWNGLPAGVLGVLMTLALGLVAGIAMVQTKGMFWSWFMHFVPDCVLFYYWGIGSVAHATIGTGQL